MRTMQFNVDQAGFNTIDKIVFAVMLHVLFGVVDPQGWNGMLSYVHTRIPQLAYEPGYSKHVSFHLWTRSNIENPVLLRIGDRESIEKSRFDRSKQTLVISHGFLNTVESPVCQDLKDAALRNYDVNVIGVDWGDFAMTPNYASAASNVRGVGNHVARFVLFLIKAGLSPRKVHLIGHSLGAHVSGFAGKKLSTSGNRVARISGLDPALPGFYSTTKLHRLHADDADFVDCIYTACGTYSFVSPICQANFYPNHGSWQPSCVMYDFAIGVCSHLVVYDYYAESVNVSHIFEGEDCDDSDSCRSARMGYHADPRTKGTFHLETRSSSPYALEIEGKRLHSALNFV